jgi:hypothetical protein
MRTFQEALEVGDEQLVHKSVVVIKNIGISAAPELISALKINVDDYITPIKDALSAVGDKYSETLEYLDS